MKTYLFGTMGKAHFDTCGTAKAFYVDYAGGCTTANDSQVWIPRSICICEEPNEFGNMRIYIPMWFFTKNRIDWRRIRDITFGEAGVGYTVQR